MNSANELDASKEQSSTSASPQPAKTITIGSVNKPGAYVSNRTGHLLRITDDDMDPTDHPTTSSTADQSEPVTKISDDPYVALSRARMVAANRDLLVNF